MKQGMDRGPNTKSKTNYKFVSLDRKVNKAHESSIRAMMCDPAMRHLSGTWMGAFYTQEKSNYHSTARSPQNQAKDKKIVKNKSKKRIKKDKKETGD